jgi:hypothetical protein
MRGAYTGSLHAPPAIATLRPTFSWAAVPETCGTISYQLQGDDSCSPGALDSCAFSSPEVDATGIATTSYTPPVALKVSDTPPVGAFYAWRVRACDASVRCSPWSEVRYLHVGRVREDINGDGYGDLLALSNRGVEVYLGRSQFDVTAPSFRIAYDSGSVPVFAGDVNGDGYGDLLGTTQYTPTAGLAPRVFYGGRDVAMLDTLVLTKAAGGPSTLMKTTSAGDMNGDGYSDLIVQWGYAISVPQTELRIFFGGSTIANTPDLSIPGPYKSDYTLQDSGRLGDVNGDGFEDIGLSAVSDGGTNGGVVQLFTGARRPTAVAVNVPIVEGTSRIERAGDFDGDGFDDAVMIVWGTTYAFYRGAATLPTSVAMTWTEPSIASGVGGFDLDGDGLSDFLAGTTAYAPILYRGGAVASIVPGGLSHLTCSRALAFSDHDGDGRPDFIGVDDSSAAPRIQWAGSDGTTNPRAAFLGLPLDTTFNGRLVR